MSCEYCGQIPHDSRCPNYIETKKFHHRCSVCGKGILIGEEYIVNDDGDYAHWDCIEYMSDLLKFLDYQVLIDEDD